MSWPTCSDWLLPEDRRVCGGVVPITVMLARRAGNEISVFIGFSSFEYVSKLLKLLREYGHWTFILQAVYYNFSLFEICEGFLKAMNSKIDVFWNVAPVIWRMVTNVSGYYPEDGGKRVHETVCIARSTLLPSTS
jgi:hypothetical protein